MLVHDGELRYLGDPEEAALRYYRLNFRESDRNAAPQGGGVPDVNVRLVDVWLENEADERVENVEQGEPIGFHAVFEARHDLERPVFQFHVLDADGVWVFGFTKTVSTGGRQPDRIAAGERVRVAGRIENPLVPGRYSVDCWISRDRPQGDVALHVLRLTEFFVYGTRPGAGSVGVWTDLEVAVEPESGL
jgi:hypothetical protein